MLQGLSEGRIVHYVLRDKDVPGFENGVRAGGRHRPAIVVNAWPNLDRDDGYSNLVVIADGNNDGNEDILLWVTSVTYSDGHEPGTWHWPEKV